MRKLVFAVLLAMVVLLPAATAAKSGHGGTIVFGSNRDAGQHDLYLVNEDGTGEHRLTFDRDDYFERTASWSPDGTRIAYAARHDGNFDVYTIDGNGGDRRRVTTDPQRDDYPHWTSDGRIVFERGLFTCPCTAWIVNADGSNAQQLPLPGNINAVDPAPKGNRIVYATDVGGTLSLHVAKLGDPGDDKLVSGDRQLTIGPGSNTNQGDFEPHWSSDRDEIVFLRDHNGIDNDIWTVNADGSGLHQLTDTPNRVEFNATWSSDGSEVIFEDNTTGKLKAIDVATGAERSVATSPRAPFTDEFSDGTIDSSMWNPIADPGSSIAEEGGRVVASIAGSAVPGGQFNQVFSGFGSQCSLPGDYDMRVDYQLLTWPHLGGFRAELHAFFANASVGRVSIPVPWAPSWNDEQVQGFSEGGGGQFASSAAGGTLRLVRKDGVAVGYVRSGDGWRPVFSGTAPGDAVYGSDLTATAAEFGHQDGKVAFDNFELTSGDLTCPDWWRDTFSDVRKD